MVKGILKHKGSADNLDSSSKSNKKYCTWELFILASLLWNEEELELNEQIKATLSAENIEEPKTPYIHDYSPEKGSDGEASTKGHSNSEGEESNSGWESTTTASSGGDDFEVRRSLHYRHDGDALRGQGRALDGNDK